MQNPWQGLVWRVAGVLNGFNGDTICRRRPLQQGKFEGYGSQWPQEGFEDIRAYRREEMRTIALKCLYCGFDLLIGTLQGTHCYTTCRDIINIVGLSGLIQKCEIMNNLLLVKG